MLMMKPCSRGKPQHLQLAHLHLNQKCAMQRGALENWHLFMAFFIIIQLYHPCSLLALEFGSGHRLLYVIVQTNSANSQDAVV